MIIYQFGNLRLGLIDKKKLGWGKIKNLKNANSTAFTWKIK